MQMVSDRFTILIKFEINSQELAPFYNSQGNVFDGNAILVCTVCELHRLFRTIPLAILEDDS